MGQNHPETLGKNIRSREVVVKNLVIWSLLKWLDPGDANVGGVWVGFGVEGFFHGKKVG